MIRSRSDSYDQMDDGDDIDDGASPTKRACVTVTSNLLCYPFLLPLLLAYLTDADVLRRLVLTGKCMKLVLTNYAVKNAVHVGNSDQKLQIIGSQRYLPVVVHDIILVDNLPEFAQLFPHLKRIRLFCEINEPLCADLLPRSLEHVTVSKFNHQIGYSVLPHGLLTINLGSSFNQHLEPNVIPASVTCLRLGTSFNQQLADSLPSGLRELHLGNAYNTNIAPGVLPQSLKILSFAPDCRFSQRFEAGVLPLGLEVLRLGEYNAPLDNPALFPNLKHLWLNSEYPVAIPPTASHLVLRRAINSSKLIGGIPDSVTHLCVGSDHETLQPGVVPMSVTNLTVFQPIVPGSVPLSVTHLTMSIWRDVKVGDIPASVTHLSVESCTKLPLSPEVIPSSVQHIWFGTNPTLTHGSIPDSVVWLNLSWGLSHALLPGMLPDSIKLLSFGYGLRCFNHPFISFRMTKPRCECGVGTCSNGHSVSAQSFVVRTLPASLETLILSSNYNQPIPPNAIPPSVKRINVGHEYNKPFQPLSVPPTVQEIILPPAYPAHQDLSHIQANINITRSGAYRYTTSWGDNRPTWTTWCEWSTTYNRTNDD